MKQRHVALQEEDLSLHKETLNLKWFLRMLHTLNILNGILQTF